MKAQGLQNSPEDAAKLRFTVKVDGKDVELPLPKLHEDEDDEEPLRSWPVLPDRAIVVTDAGRQLIHGLLGDTVAQELELVEEINLHLIPMSVQRGEGLSF
jgi:hypothetical protein